MQDLDVHALLRGRADDPAVHGEQRVICQLHLQIGEVVTTAAPLALPDAGELLAVDPDDGPRRHPRLRELDLVECLALGAVRPEPHEERRGDGGGSEHEGERGAERDGERPGEDRGDRRELRVEAWGGRARLQRGRPARGRHPPQAAHERHSHRDQHVDARRGSSEPYNGKENHRRRAYQRRRPPPACPNRGSSHAPIQPWSSS
ncbi:hypothetical protein E5N77_36135 [Streptomyces sp. SS52]|nr:hypothetical protein E5N77_36135 [Streptomyces sp. SS52]